MQKFIEMTDEVYRELTDFLDTHVTHGKMTYGEVALKLGIQRNALHKIKEGKTKKVKPETWEAINTLIAGKIALTLEQTLAESARWEKRFFECLDLVRTTEKQREALEELHKQAIHTGKFWESKFLTACRMMGNIDKMEYRSDAKYLNFGLSINCKHDIT